MNFYSKYVKYKNKYLELKNLKGRRHAEAETHFVKKNVEFNIPKVGVVKAMVIHPVDGIGANNKVVLIHGASQKPINEWVTIAEGLAKHGYHCLIPDFHSNTKTSPETATPLVFGKFMDYATRVYFNERPILAGKSWGGMQAALYAGNFPGKLRGLILAAPAQAGPEVPVSITSPEVPASIARNPELKVLFLFALDDTKINWGEDALRPWYEELSTRITVHTETTGGHRVLHEYGPVIEKFVMDRFAEA